MDHEGGKEIHPKARGGGRRFTGRPAFFCLLFIAASLLFGWPLVSIADDGVGLFIQLFASGLVVILLLLAAARALSALDRDHE